MFFRRRPTDSSILIIVLNINVSLAILSLNSVEIGARIQILHTPVPTGRLPRPLNPKKDDQVGLGCVSLAGFQVSRERPSLAT